MCLSTRIFDFGNAAMSGILYRSCLVGCFIVAVIDVQIQEVSAAKLETWRLDCFDYNLQIQDTISACSTYLRGGKPNPRYFIKRGGVWLFLKDYEYAISDFTKAIDKNYGGLLPYYGRAVAYVGSGQFYGALRDLEAVISRSVPDPLLNQSIYNLLAWISLKEREENISNNNISDYLVSDQMIAMNEVKLINKNDSNQLYIAIIPLILFMLIICII